MKVISGASTRTKTDHIMWNRMKHWGSWFAYRFDSSRRSFFFYQTLCQMSIEQDYPKFSLPFDLQNASPPPIQASPIVKSSPSTNVTKSQLRVMKQKRQQFRRPDDRGSNGSSRGASSGLITNTFSFRIFSFEYSSIFARVNPELGFSSGHSPWRI